MLNDVISKKMKFYRMSTNWKYKNRDIINNHYKNRVKHWKQTKSKRINERKTNRQKKKTLKEIKLYTVIDNHMLRISVVYTKIYKNARKIIKEIMRFLLN